MTTPQHAQTPAQDTVIVVDYGSDDAQLLARRIREAGVYSEVHSYTTGADTILAANPAALVIAARSTVAEPLPTVDPKLLNSGIPVLAVSGGYMAVAQSLGATLETGRQLTNTTVDIADADDNSALFSGQPATQHGAVNLA